MGKFYWLLLAGLVVLGPLAQAQTDCTPTARSTLMSQLSDAAPAGSITPHIIRNGICSTTRGLAATGTAQTVGTSPTTFTATSPGKVIVSSGKVEISGDGAISWSTVSLSGGVIPVATNDIVRVTWYGTEGGGFAKPLITWYPGQ